MKERVEIFYGFDKSEDKERCPGEKECGMFNVAKMETGDGLEACHGCAMLSTKPGQVIKTESNDLDIFIDSLYEIRQERLSGFGIDEYRITNRQYNFLKVLDFETEQCEAKTRIMIRILSEQNLQMMRALMPQ